MKGILGLVLLLTSTSLSFAQNPGGSGNRGNRGGQQMTGSFYGKIIDSLTNKPIELVSVQLVRSRLDTVTKTRKEMVVTGMLTKSNGEFRLENVPVFGQYKLRISVVGFKPLEKNVSF